MNQIFFCSSVIWNGDLHSKSTQTFDLCRFFYVVVQVRSLFWVFAFIFLLSPSLFHTFFYLKLVDLVINCNWFRICHITFAFFFFWLRSSMCIDCQLLVRICCHYFFKIETSSALGFGVWPVFDVSCHGGIVVEFQVN